MIDYKKALNAAQYEAVTTVNGPVLVIAGAGSGKTRTIVYRLAYLAEQGVAPSAMLLLTFTRKAAQSMLQRASALAGQSGFDHHGDGKLGYGGHALAQVQGGTFHGFAYTVLRQFAPDWLESGHVSIMDSADIAAAVKQCKDELKLGKGDRSFPKTQNIVGILSKARNKELPVDEVLRREAFHLLPHADALHALGEAYTAYRRAHSLLDYDDLLFEFESVLRTNARAADYLRRRFSHVMVDEYQDTNLVQARIVRLLSSTADGGVGNIMAVGDDAQSIYAFRGANVRNILDFEKLFPGARIIKLEENYRSTQAVLNVANALLEGAQDGFSKHLFTSREGGDPVRLVSPVSDFTQAEVVTRRVAELLHDHLPHEIAVLFRAGFHSYQLEMALNRAGIPFRKFGGLRYTEAAHVKDVIAFARLCLNPLDMPAFQRVAALHGGVGPKTAQKLYAVATAGNAPATEKAFARFPAFLADMRFLDEARALPGPPSRQLQDIVEHYKPMLESLYPDDWPRRQQGLEEIIQMAGTYDGLDVFLADLALESPEEDDKAEGCITLSTVHSAKGLEWNAVLVIDVVEDRFPSRHAAARVEEFEEERRLLYVACTRARHQLDLYAPTSIYSRADQSTVFATRSPFLRELPAKLCEEWVEGYGGVMQQKPSFGGGGAAPRPPRLLPQPVEDSPFPPAVPFKDTQDIAKDSDGAAAGKLGFCHHKIFGRGKMIKFLPPDKYQVNFPGFGLKVIMADFLRREE
ncbi:MAG: ATP-dependent helicase [Desulfovibrionaceae bacterium]